MNLSLQMSKMDTRQYEAIVHGHVDQDSQSIVAPIGRKATSIIEREVREDGQYAHTDVTVIQRFYLGNEPMTHVALKLHTGRTHQIRVHMSSLGHPLVGDELYGGSRLHMDRQALHCVSLNITHPLTSEHLQFTSMLNEDMQNLLKGSSA